MPKKHVNANTQPLLLTLPMRGEISPRASETEGMAFGRIYQNPSGQLFQGDSIAWLRSLPSESVDLIFADPPYNIKKAAWDQFESQEHYIRWSMQWIQEAARVLTAAGTMYVCGFSEVLADIKHPAMHYFAGCRWLIWHYKNKANLGRDWGRSHESILHLRKDRRAFTFNLDDVRIPYGKHTVKYPAHPQAASSQYGNGGKRQDVWTPHPQGAKPKDVIEIPTTCNGMEEKTPHPTQKPEELLRRLMRGSSHAGDLVLDPFSGSGTTLVVAEQLQRRWLGCELRADYNHWAIKRLETVVRKTQAEWILHDRLNEDRRNSIR